MAHRAFLGGPRRGPWTSLKFLLEAFYYPYQKLLEVRYNETFSRKGSSPPYLEKKRSHSSDF